MKKLITGTTMVATAILLCSCAENEKNSVSVPSLTQYKKGNYWIYDIYKVESNGAVSKTSLVDSVVVLGDSIIRGKRFSVQERTSALTNKRFKTFARDSGEYLLDIHGAIILTTQRSPGVNYTSYSVLGVDTVAKTEYMTRQIAYINVPAGNYYSYVLWGTIYSLPLNTHNSPRNFMTGYSDGVGKVFESYLIPTDNFHYEERLVRYKIN